MKNCLWLVLLAAASAWAQPLLQQDSPAPFGLHHSVFVVKLLSPLSTRTAREGDVFTASVEEPAAFAGGVVEGHITKLKRPRKGTNKGNAEIQFQFDTLTFGDQTVPIKAELSDVKNSEGKSKVDEEGHVIGVSSNKKRILSALAGAGIGGLIGAAKAGPAGAALGAGLGAAAGLVVGLKMTTKASQIELQPGALFTLKITEISKQQANNK